LLAIAVDETLGLLEPGGRIGGLRPTLNGRPIGRIGTTGTVFTA
jgi:hypothetical protein